MLSVSFKVMVDVLDIKHHEDWFTVLEHMVQLTAQQQSHSSVHSASKSSEAAIARKKLRVDEFTDLLIVKKSAEFYVRATSSQERDKFCQLFIGSLTLPETNKLLVSESHTTDILLYCFDLELSNIINNILQSNVS